MWCRECGGVAYVLNATGSRVAAAPSSSSSARRSSLACSSARRRRPRAGIRSSAISAAELLLRPGVAGDEHRLPVELVVRASTGPPPGR